MHCNKGRIAVAHNGNITNAAELRADLEARGSIFQASSDTEVILHLVAHSRETHAGRRAARCAAAARRRVFAGVSGARTASSWRAIRTASVRWPWGKWKFSGGRKRYVFASETCAFDLINAVYLGDVSPARW